ncbi:MAG: serine/threonine-protein kinase [Firmicutes bacterium HGW-Firmicutes-11]|jgi:serine/threonine-protein kinase|nr:MAG: serine/threonine-protein kinase [Firmicutes bacterium HGW-Firmicutes-11]
MSSRLLAERYELLEKIGDGGMAVVYRSRDRLLNRHVAVKILKPEFIKDHKFIESFRRESQAAASLSHPNIVNVYDVGKEGGIHYIVMELIEGQPLSDRIKEEGAIKPWEAVSIAKQIAAALSHAHKNHIIHRDVKPHNIMLTNDGTAKITDFGIAKAFNTGTIVGNTGSIMGSVHYFSPEQARGGYVDEKTDIYSLGIVLFEMLTGKVPYDAENPVAVALMHTSRDMPLPSDVVDDIPPDLEAVVMKATDKYQVNRYKSADEMLEALNHASLSAIGVSGGNPRNRGLDATMVMAAVNRQETTPPADGSKENIDRGDQPVKVKKRFKFNKIKVGAIVLALALAIPVSQLILSVIEAGGTPAEVTVPELSGMTVEEATLALEELELLLKVDKEVTSAEYPEGQIVSQDPLAEMIVKTGKTITVNVSKGVEAGTIPNVIGKTQGDAVFLLESNGYTRGGVSEENSDMPVGIVIRQSPTAGTEAEEGTSVSLVVSKGPAAVPTVVPTLIGLDVDGAKVLLERENLELGEISYAPSNDFEQNIIMGQGAAPGSSVLTGSKIGITISTGPDETGGAGEVVLSISYDAAANEVFYLTIVVSDASGVATPVNYEQRIKSDGSESFTVTGTGQGTVRIYFDNALVQEHVVDFDSGVAL